MAGKDPSFDKSFVFRMPKELHELLKAHADATGKSMNQMLLEICVQGMRGWEDPDDEEISKKYRDVAKALPDYSTKMEAIEFIISNGKTSRDWSRMMIASGYRVDEKGHIIPASEKPKG